MSILVRDALWDLVGRLRHEPIETRLRAVLGDETVVDTTRAALVWEPRRVVPSYAVPVEEVRATLTPAEGRPDEGQPVLHPGIPFTVHSAPGEALTVAVGGHTRPGAAFRPADPDLAGYVVLDFDAFDAWYEEDERVVAHPREPFHNVEIRPSSRHVTVEYGGRVVADSRRPTLVFETGLPTRFYLPAEDVSSELRPSDQVTQCAYKGRASYLSLDDRPNLAWYYPDPLPGVDRLAGLVAFFDEIVDVTVDGVRRSRPDTPVAKVMIEEFGL